jgi:hypothetical protein
VSDSLRDAGVAVCDRCGFSPPCACAEWVVTIPYADGRGQAVVRVSGRDAKTRAYLYAGMVDNATVQPPPPLSDDRQRAAFMAALAPHRYDLLPTSRCGQTFDEMSRDVTGEWIRVEDVEAAWLATQPKETPPETCAWREDISSEFWESACGKTWCFADGGPAENDVLFCHGCGKPVALVPYDPQESA